MKNKDYEKVKIPFHPIILLLFSVLFTFLVGGIIAGINWTRLLKPQWKYPTIGITALGFALFIFAYSHIPSSFGRFVIYLSYAVFIVVGAVLYLIQKPYYDMWKNGEI